MAVDMFLKIDGIDGDSPHHKHKGEIELLSFSWGLANTQAGTGGGGGAGKPNISDFAVMKQMNNSSPHLMEKCCQGEHISEVLITLAKAGDDKQDFYKIKLTDCIISSYQIGGSNTGGAVPVESVTFSFSSVDISAADKKGQFVSQAGCNFSKLNNSIVGHNHG
jgi:type VI secretion system secreted protein Hcp